MMSFCMKFEKKDVGYCRKLSEVRESGLLAKSMTVKREALATKGFEHESV